MSHMMDLTKSLIRMALPSASPIGVSSSDANSVRDISLYQALVLEGLCNDIFVKTHKERLHGITRVLVMLSMIHITRPWWEDVGGDVSLS